MKPKKPPKETPEDIAKREMGKLTSLKDLAKVPAPKKRGY